MAKTKAKQYPPLEVNAVICSLIILKGLGKTEEQRVGHDLLGEFWTALYDYRVSMKPEKWTERILEGILSGDPKFDKGPAWEKLNQILNEVWEKINAQE